MKDFSFIINSDPVAIEELYNSYLCNPDKIDEDYKFFFAGFDYAMRYGVNRPVVEKIKKTEFNEQEELASSINIAKEFSVYQLIRSYRKKGHLLSNTNPIRKRKNRNAALSLDNFNLNESDLDLEFEAGKFVGLGRSKLKTIVEYLNSRYCATVGLDITSINYYEKTKWLQDLFEKEVVSTIDVKIKKRILEKLNQAVLFEKFLHTKYVGQKRFSLEGGEAIIPALDFILTRSADLGVEQVAIGMAHRGRLNVLANVLGKTYEQIFNEFEGNNYTQDTTMGSGDVKYHLGFRSSLDTYSGKKINVHLGSNPSHLEAICPVIAGFARAYGDFIHMGNYQKVMPIVIHGDSSISGQGVVYELLQMSKLEGYHNKGTIHIVINNQIGFTTDFDDARSSDYCTSIAATVQAPVFHVNGDDIEAVVKCAEMAVEYRQKFCEDVFIDIVCYRKHGHNEGDDPKFTQPLLYDAIDRHHSIRDIYIEYLKNHVDPDVQKLSEELEKKFWEDLQSRLDGVKQKSIPYLRQGPENSWRKIRKAKNEDFISSPSTGIEPNQFQFIFDRLMSLPGDFKPLRKINKLLQDKIDLLKEKNMVDWATAELLAYGSLLNEGKDIRISGEDVKRGTFSHRHACVYEEYTNREYNRLSFIAPKQGTARIYNSLLSEYAVLGFEYGYSIVSPDNLTIWEAQFGDFANGAQIIIDQFISSGEEKWQQYSGLVLLLPHGYEGQGAEHSSARIERFLQLCAENNMLVTNITTASNIFHVLRRQLAWEFRKPLVNFSPKANLRLPGTYSDRENFLCQTKFEEILDCPFVSDVDPDGIKKVLFCSGKVYFDLYEYQSKNNVKSVAIVRVEQLYPLAIGKLESLVNKYKNATWYWVQEEPLNMGAVSFLQLHCKFFNYGVISRNSSASSATGYSKIHQTEQQNIVYTAFNV